MRALDRAAVAAVLVAVGSAAAVPVPADAQPLGAPFYLVPSTTTECQGIKNCRGTKGPWVEVPAHGETTYLFGCPRHIAFVVAGTDAVASSRDIRVWFTDRIGGRIGPPQKPRGAAVLLFQAASNDGRAGWFQPIVGCVSLVPKNKRSTVSARAATPPSPPVDLRAENLVPRIQTGLGVEERPLRCPGRERPVASWSAFSMFTPNPPDPSFHGAMAISTRIRGDRVIGRYRITRPVSNLAPRFFVQIGAQCLP